MKESTRIATIVGVFGVAGVVVYLAYTVRVLDLPYLVTAGSIDAVAAVTSYLLTRGKMATTQQSSPQGGISINMNQTTVVPTSAPEPRHPSLQLRPLPDYAGYLVLPSPAKVTVNPDGTKTAVAVNDTHSTTAEFGLLAPSQHFEAGFGPIDQPLKSVTAKFGVIRVKALGGSIPKCHVEVSYRRVSIAGEPVDRRWLPAGRLNWFDIGVKHKTAHAVEKIYPARWGGLNSYLANPMVDLNEGEERDLLLVYMIRDVPTVFLCTDSVDGGIGLILNDVALLFEVELRIAGETLPVQKSRYLIAAKWDYNKIQESPSP